MTRDEIAARLAGRHGTLVWCDDAEWLLAQADALAAALTVQTFDHQHPCRCTGCNAIAAYRGTPA